MIECVEENIWRKKFKFKNKLSSFFVVVIILIITTIFLFVYFALINNLLNYIDKKTYYLCIDNVNTAVRISIIDDINYNNINCRNSFLRE